MEYKRYLDYNLIYKNGKEEIKKEEFPKKDPIMYYIYKLGKIANKAEKMYKDIDENTDGKDFSGDVIDLTDELLDKFLYKINFFSNDFLKDYNNNFSFAYLVDRYMTVSPFEINKKEMDDFFRGIDQDEGQDDVELYLKNMQLFNRCAHIIEEFTEHILGQNVNNSFYMENQDIDINKEYQINAKFKREYDKRSKIYTKAFNELYKMCGKPIGTNRKFIKLYEEKLNNKITDEEFVESDIVKTVYEKIKTIDNNGIVKFDNDNIYSFFKLKNVKFKMFKLKNDALNNAVKKYVELEDINEKNKYKITKCKDTTKDNRDSYKNVISFNIEGYNSPYSVHLDDEMLKEIENELSKINEKIEDDVNKENQILQYKYSEEQKEKIIDFKGTFSRYSGKWSDRYEKFSRTLNEIYENVKEKSNDEIELT